MRMGMSTWTHAERRAAAAASESRAHALRWAWWLLALLAATVALCAAVFLCAAPCFADDEEAAESATAEAAESAEDAAAEAAEAAETAEAEATASSTAEAQSSASPSASSVSNKPETSPSPSGEITPVIDLEGNVINTAQLPDSSFLYDTSIEALTGADSYFDNQVVQVTGEAVGDSIKAGTDDSHRWLTLASTQVDVNETLAVFVSKDSAELVDGFGKYGRTGTILQVRGEFHLACGEHDGITDLHAENVNVVEASQDHPDSFELGVYIPGVLLVGVGVIALLAYRIMREKRR